jgi:hypothetical protein
MDVAFLVRAADRNLRSLLTIVNFFGAVLALILSSMTVSASVLSPAKKTSKSLIIIESALIRRTRTVKNNFALFSRQFKVPAQNPAQTNIADRSGVSL